MRKIIALALLGVFLVGCSSRGKVTKVDGVVADSNIASETEVSDEDNVIETLEALDDTSNLNIDQSILDKLNALNEPYTLAEDTYAYTDIPDKSLTQPYLDLFKSEYGIEMKHPTFIYFKYKQGKLYFETVKYYSSDSLNSIYFDSSKLTDLYLDYTTEENKSKAKKLLKLLNFPSDIEPTEKLQSIDIDGVEYKYKISSDEFKLYTTDIEYKEVDLSVRDKIIGMIHNLNKIPYSNLNKLDAYGIKLQYLSNGELYDIELDNPANLNIYYNKSHDYLKIAYCLGIKHAEGNSNLDVARYILKGHALEKIAENRYKVKDKKIYVDLDGNGDIDFSIEYKQ